jgi:hypothetical protein
MEAPQGPENVNPQVVLVTGKVASAGSKLRVRMTNKRLLVVLATLNVNPHLVKKFLTYGQKMKTCIELHARLLAQARIVEKDKDSTDQDASVPSVDVRCTVLPAVPLPTTFCRFDVQRKTRSTRVP